MHHTAGNDFDSVLFLATLDGLRQAKELSSSSSSDRLPPSSGDAPSSVGVGGGERRAVARAAAREAEERVVSPARAVAPRATVGPLDRLRGPRH